MSRLCPCCGDPIDEHEQGFPPSEIETGERYMVSELTEQTYRVTKWVDKGDGKMVALQKEPVDLPDDHEGGDSER